MSILERFKALSFKETDKKFEQFNQKGFLFFFALRYLNPDEFGSGVYATTATPEWRNIGEHGLVAGVYAELLCELLNVDEVSKQKVVRAALLHDAFKRKEIEAFQRNQNPSEGEVAEIMGINKAFLEHIGVDDETLVLAGANVPVTSAGPQTLSEKIVWYVDAMLMDTEPTDITARMRRAIKNALDPARSVRNAWIHAKKYDNGKTLHEVQIEVGKKLSNEFVELLHLDVFPSDFPYYLKTLFEQKVKNFDSIEVFNEMIQLSAVGKNGDLDNELGSLRNVGLTTILLDEYFYQIFGEQLFGDLVYRDRIG